MQSIVGRFHKLLNKYDTCLTALVAKLPDEVKPLMSAASMVGLPLAIIGLALLMALAAWLSGQSSIAMAQLAAIVALGGNTAIKYTVRRKRPDTLYVENMKIKSYSFPSGHTFGSTVVYGLLATLMYFYLPGGITSFAIGSLVLLIMLIGVSRVYLGAHFPSDVTLGWILGGLSVFLIAEFILL